jgi:hypothetical protein
MPELTSTVPISIPSDQFTALAGRWRDLIRQSQTRTLPPAEYAEFRRIEDECRAAVLAVPAQQMTVVPFTLDADVPDAAFVHAHELFVSRKLNFAWVDPSTPSPVVLDHPDEPGVHFYRCDLSFLAWVRGRCKLAHERNRPLSPSEQRLVDRVWVHACHRAKIDDDCPERVPPPSSHLPGDTE